MTRRPRILHLRASRFVGGPEKQLLRYAEAELNGSYEIVLGTFVGPDEGQEFFAAVESRGFLGAALPDSMWGYKSALAELKRLLRREKIDLLCTHGYKADILGLLARSTTGVQVVPFLRGWTREDWKVRFYEFLDRLAILRADRIVTLSKIQADRVAAETGHPEKIRIVPNAIDLPLEVPGHAKKAREALLERFQFSADSFLIASAGRFSPEKGTVDLLLAAARLKPSHDSMRWILFGDGVLREKLSALAKELELDDRVIFAGFEKSLRELLPGFDLLVNPSISEEMPNIVLEGMAAGIPVVATDVGGVREIAGPTSAIALVPAGRPDEMARTISDLKIDTARSRALASAGYERVSTAFSPEAQIQSIQALYRELILNFPQGDNLNDLAASASSSSSKEGFQNGQAPFLSIVIPVRNEEDHLAAVLDALLDQDYPRDRYEIIVADGMSDDRTAEIIENYSRRSQISIRRVENPLRLSSAGRNTGFRSSCGEYILFIDGHCYLPSDRLLLDTAALFQKTGADCLCRPQPLDAPGNTTFQRAVAAVRASTLGHGLDSTIFDVQREAFIAPMSSGASYRRAVFERIGLYDEHFDACEDVEFNFRVHQAGLRAYTSPKLLVRYQPRSSLTALWRQVNRYGRGRFRLAQKHPEASSLAQLIPAALVLWLVIGLFLSLFFPVAAWLFGGVLLLYIGVVFFNSLLIMRNQGLRAACWTLPIYPVVHLGLGTGYLRETVASFFGRSNLSTCAKRSLGTDGTARTVPGRTVEK